MQNWYLVYTKPRQEQLALENIARQGYTCFLPQLPEEKVVRGVLCAEQRPLFPRYLFVQLDTDMNGRSWAPIRSTTGVSRLVSFGHQPAKVANDLVSLIDERCNSGVHKVKPLFQPGERLSITQGPFAGVEAIFKETNAERRIMVLIELMSRTVTLELAPNQITRLG
jgi:transcriptional antiterminator RfaH